MSTAPTKCILPFHPQPAIVPKADPPTQQGTDAGISQTTHLTTTERDTPTPRDVFPPVVWQNCLGHLFITHNPNPKVIVRVRVRVRVRVTLGTFDRDLGLGLGLDVRVRVLTPWTQS